MNFQITAHKVHQYTWTDFNETYVETKYIVSQVGHRKATTSHTLVSGHPFLKTQFMRTTIIFRGA